MMPLVSAFAPGWLVVMALAVILPMREARAQVPPEIAEINSCLCLQQAYTALAAEMNAKSQALDVLDHQLADLDAQLRQQRTMINVNDPDAIARFKALLNRRDVTDRQLPAVHAAADQAVGRYNARVNEYNARCANRPFNSALVAAAQIHLVCPPLQ